MKNKFLILLFTLFSIFVFTDRVDALSYNVNGVDYQVNSYKTIRDYAYFNYVKPNNYNYLSIWCSKTTLCFIYVGNFDNHYYYNNNELKFYGSNPVIQYLYNGSTFDLRATGNGSYGFGLPSVYKFKYTNINVYSDNTFNNVLYSPNYTFGDIELEYGNITTYDIKYYLNNQLYDTITVKGGSSHSLLNPPVYDDSLQKWSGWTYDSNIDLNNITQDITINGTITDKAVYDITYYINDKVYYTDHLIEGNSYNLLDYSPPKNYIFNGWTYDNNIDLNNINSNFNVYGTTTFVRPVLTYSDDINSPIHNLSVSILGNDIPIEFDFLYTIMDFIILCIIILCVLSPFFLAYKFLGGGF